MATKSPHVTYKSNTEFLTPQIDMVSIDIVEVDDADQALSALTDFTGHEKNDYSRWVCPSEFYDRETRVARCYKIYSTRRIDSRPLAVVVKPKPINPVKPLDRKTGL